MSYNWDIQVHITVVLVCSHLINISRQFDVLLQASDSSNSSPEQIHCSVRRKQIYVILWKIWNLSVLKLKENIKVTLNFTQIKETNKGRPSQKYQIWWNWYLSFRKYLAFFLSMSEKFLFLAKFQFSLRTWAKKGPTSSNYSTRCKSDFLSVWKPSQLEQNDIAITINWNSCEYYLGIKGANWHFRLWHTQKIQRVLLVFYKSFRVPPFSQ